MVDRRRLPTPQAALGGKEPGIADTSPRGSSSGRSMGPFVCMFVSRKLELSQSLGAPKDQSDPAGVAEDPEREPAAPGLDLCGYEDQRVDEAAEIHRQELRAAGARSGRPGSLLTLAPHRSGRAGCRDRSWARAPVGEE